MVQQMAPPIAADREATQEATDEPLRMTLEEFQVWYTEGRRGEWVDGEVIEFVAPKTMHQEISVFLSTLLRFFVDTRGLGRVLPQPEMRLRHGGSYREPDLVFVAAENADRITAEGVNGPGDLVVEIVSDDSVRRDRKQKFDEYAEAGVREYWVIDPRPLRRTVMVYALSDEGLFDPIVPNERGEIRSVVVPGFWVQPTWLWGERTPNVVEVLRAIDATS